MQIASKTKKSHIEQLNNLVDQINPFKYGVSLFEYEQAFDQIIDSEKETAIKQKENNLKVCFFNARKL